MESVQSSNIELVIKSVANEGIVIQDTKEINEKNEELETTEYFLDVEEQTTEEGNEDTQFVHVDGCEENHEQYIAMEVQDTNRLVIQDKDIIFWSNLCRICANHSDKLIPIFNGEGLEHNLCNKIHNYLPIKISESDNLPLQVCYNCAATLLAWHEMSKGCLNAQQRLINLQSKFNLKNQYYTNSIVKQENIEAILEVEATNNEESQVPATNENNVESFHIDVSDAESSNRLQRDCSTFKEYKRAFRPTLPAKRNRKKTPSPSKSVKKRSSRSIRKKSMHKVAKMKITSDVHCTSINLESKSSECLSFAEGKFQDLTETEAEIVNNSAELNQSPEENSKSKKSCRGRNGSGLECRECNKKFRLYNSYQIHMRIHTGEKPYTCHICGKQFGQTGSLYYHLKHVHGGVKNHACDICGRCFAMKTAMEDHRRIHTGERPYICDSCGKSFKTKASLYIHSKIHTNEYPFKCSYCKKLFRWKQQMMNHLTTHTGEKNHMCDICGKGFGVKNELTRHRRTHSLDKPFTCQKCGVSFGQKRYLTNHNRTRHKTKATSN